MITAYGNLLQHPADRQLVIRRFRPRISNQVSVLTPGYATRSLLASNFTRELQAAVVNMQDEMDALLTAG